MRSETRRRAQQDCEELGLVGPAARACGVVRDVRQDFPSGIYRFAFIPVSTWHTGDVFARAYVRWMRENGGGVIVNTSSTSGLIGNFGQSNYGAAKGGIWGFSNVLAIEGRKYNIRVWTLAPGALTRMTADLPRYKENPGAALSPDGIAPAVLYMVSDLSGDQTGKVLGVSGPRGVREMRMMEREGWKPPHTGWKAQDIVEHANEIFFSEEEIKRSARRF